MGVGGPRAVRESFQNLKETGKAMILAQTEIAKLYDWLIPHVVEKHREHPNTSIEIIQSFSTGIGINSYAHCTGCGEKHEITDYGIW